MRVLDVEGVATHNGPESCAVAGNCLGEALTGGGVGPVLSREINEPLSGAETLEVERRQYPVTRYRECLRDPARSKTRCMRPSTSCGNREIPRLAQADGVWVRKGNLSNGGYRR
jgi:RNA-directed DNA polymerase